MKLNFVLPVVLACVVLPCRSEPVATAEKSYLLASEKPEKVPGLAMTLSDEMTMKEGSFTLDTLQGAFEGSMDLETTKVIETRSETASKIKAKITTSKSE